MNGYRESDSLIVSKKPLNKIGDNKPAAEISNWFKRVRRVLPFVSGSLRPDRFRKRIFDLEPQSFPRRYSFLFNSHMGIPEL